MKTTNPNKTSVKLTQIQQELESFRRQMVFIKEENIYLKNRLSEVLKETTEPALVEELEIFQTRFIHYDMAVSISRSDIVSLESLLQNDFAEREEDFQLQKLKKMRSEFLALFIEFSNLKFNFSNFLLEKL